MIIAPDFRLDYVELRSNTTNARRIRPNRPYFVNHVSSRGRFVEIRGFEETDLRAGFST